MPTIAFLTLSGIVLTAGWFRHRQGEREAARVIGDGEATQSGWPGK